MAVSDAILAAVQRIHEAPVTPDGWARALPSIAAAVDSDGSFLLSQSAATGAAEFIAGYEIAPHSLAAYAAAVSAGRPAWAIALPAGVVTQSSAMMPDHAYARSIFYNEAVRPEGRFYGLAVVPHRSPQRSVYLATGRRLGREDYSAGDVTAMQILVPHLATALRVGQHLAAADLRAAGAGGALDRLATGTILLDAAGKVLFANGIAEAILLGSDGLRTDRDGLCACEPRTTRTLRRLVATCVDAGLADSGCGGTFSAPRAGGHMPLHVVVAPFRSGTAPAEISWLGPARPAAILIVTDPEREGTERRRQLRERYGLTAAEADFALEVIRGDGRQAAATRLGISLATARTHLERIFAKTGVHRQAELVRVLLQEGDDCAKPEARGDTPSQA